MNFKIRAYEESDVPQLLSVIKKAFKEYRGKINPPSSAERKTVEIIRAELIKANAIVAEFEQELIGCIFYQPKNESIYIDRLSVLPDFRNRGVATALIKCVEQRARDQKYKSLTLSVRLSLVQQQIYYKKLGFECDKLEIHEGFQEPTSMKMVKVLRQT